MILIVRKLTKRRFNLSTYKKLEQYKLPNSQLINLGNAVKEIIWNMHLVCKNMDDNYNSFMAKRQTIRHSLMRKVKCKPGQRHYLPCLNEKIPSLMKQRDHALTMALKNKVENERCLFTTLRNKTLKELRKAKSMFSINAINEAKGNAKEI